GFAADKNQVRPEKFSAPVGTAAELWSVLPSPAERHRGLKDFRLPRCGHGPCSLPRRSKGGIMATASRTISTVKSRRERTAIQVLDTPLAQQDASLAKAVEATLHDVLGPEELGVLEVRFRVCRESEE